VTRRSGAAVAAVVVVLAGCTGPEPVESPTEPPVTTPTVRPSAVNEAYREVEFTARDGEVRSGRLFGDGEVAVVLSHMGRSGDDQDDWAGFAEQLADRGYQALTYQRRSDMGAIWQDVLGGADYLRARGAEKVIAAGASIGAMASLHAAEQPDSNLDGVIWLAGVRQNRGYDFQEADVSQVACPILFISGDQDAYGAAADARQLHDWATAPSELLILQSRRHGTDIFTEGGPNPRELTEAMLDFVERVADESHTC
jgi:dienelactone hydrolase